MQQRPAADAKEAQEEKGVHPVGEKGDPRGTAERPDPEIAGGENGESEGEMNEERVLRRRHRRAPAEAVNR